MIDSAILGASQFLDNQVAKDILVLLNKIKELPSGIEQETMVQNTLRYLQRNLDDVSYKSISKNNVFFHDMIWTCLVELADDFPLNQVDPITQEVISPEFKVVSSTGHQFDIRVLIQFHNKRSLRVDIDKQEKYHLINPITNLSFSERDEKYILDKAKIKGLKVTSSHVTASHRERTRHASPRPTNTRYDPALFRAYDERPHVNIWAQLSGYCQMAGI